jgi:hypothetical protein
MQVKKAAGHTPVSQWVTELIENHLDDAALELLWQEFCRDVGPTRTDSRRAHAIFKRLTRPARRRAA